MLTICAFWGSVNRQLPQVNYAKAVDYYFIVSFLFILLTLVEFTIVLNVDFDSWKTKSVKKQSGKDTLKREKSLRNQLPVSIPFFLHFCSEISFSSPGVTHADFWNSPSKLK